METQSNSRAVKLALFFMICGAISWLGGTNIRAIIAFDLFETGTLNYKTWLPPDAERQAFHLIAYTALYTICGYIMVFISFTVFLAKTKLKLRENGWLMMCVIMFYMFVPVEIYQIVYDVQMVLQERAVEGVINWFAVRTEAQSLLKGRLAALSGVPVIALLCYYTCIALAVWQPMKKIPKTPLSESNE